MVFGFMLGAVAALACSATRLWNNKYKRVAALVISGGQAAFWRLKHDQNPFLGVLWRLCMRTLLLLTTDRH